VKLKMSLATALVVALAAAAALAAPSAKAASPATGAITVPITSTATSTSTGILTNGQFAVSQFQVVNGQLVAVGTLTGTVTDLAGNVIGTISQTITLPVSGGTGSCQILNLTLGPLDLNLLGLMVHLDTVHLTITAQQGPGNLLGNLLCAVANLLNGSTAPTALQQLANLLNQILGLL
jgi:hypothetical protein